MSKHSEEVEQTKRRARKLGLDMVWAPVNRAWVLCDNKIRAIKNTLEEVQQFLSDEEERR